MEKKGMTACPSCGTKNASESKRCASCGGPMDALRSVRPSAMGGPESAMQQEGFSVMWCSIGLVVQAVLTAALVIGIPMVVRAIDFEGSYGMAVCIPVWFLGGILLGMISPGRTFLEPVIAALLVAIPTVLYLYNTQTVRTMPGFMYAILAAIGVMFSLIGSYIGERIQMGPPPKTVE